MITFMSFFSTDISIFSNHLYGQDTLHLDIYDKDTIKDEKIGSVQIDLHQLYLKGCSSYPRLEVLFNFLIFFVGHIDDWFDILDTQGQIHLVLHYEKLEI